MINFSIDTKIYGITENNSNVFRDENTLGYLFVNSGNCPLRVNNILLQAGDTFKSFEPLCKDVTTYKIIFLPNQFTTPNSCQTDFAELTAIIYNQI